MFEFLSKKKLKMGETKMKKFLKIVGVIIAAFILVLAGGWFYITRGLDAGSIAGEIRKMMND